MLSRTNFQSNSAHSDDRIAIKIYTIQVSNLTLWLIFSSNLISSYYSFWGGKFFYHMLWTFQKLKLSTSVCSAASRYSLLWLRGRCCSVYHHPCKLIKPLNLEWGKALGLKFRKEGTTHQLPLEQAAFSASCMKILHFYRDFWKQWINYI